MKKSNGCDCCLHKERRFVLSLKDKLSDSEFKKLENVFESKWDQAEENCILKEKLALRWPGYRYRKALTDMYEMGWMDNLTYLDLLNKTRLK